MFCRLFTACFILRDIGTQKKRIQHFVGISFVARSSPFIVPTVKLRYIVIQEPAAHKKSLVSAPSFCLPSFALDR
jgi:hypothetical protein